MGIDRKLTMFSMAASIFLLFAITLLNGYVAYVIANDIDFINNPKFDLKLVLVFSSLFTTMLATIPVIILYRVSSRALTTHQWLTESNAFKNDF